MSRDHAPEFDDSAFDAKREQLRTERERRGICPIFVPSDFNLLDDAAQRHEARRFTGASVTGWSAL